ncbi:MAG: DUF4199 domain-containing protein [Bacteroidetes bacterium]|nr:DUF4199 domain-containing protein [Bacteroidota bacterium]
MKNINATKKGVLAALVMIILSLVFFYVLKYPVSGNNQIVILLVYVAAVIWSLLSFKSADSDTLKFKDYFSEGFKTFVVITLLMVIFTYVFYKFNPQILEDGIKLNNELLQKQGDHTPAEIEANSKKLRDIFLPMMTAINTLKYLIIGALVAAIGAGFLSQKNKNNLQYSN